MLGKWVFGRKQDIGRRFNQRFELDLPVGVLVVHQRYFDRSVSDELRRRYSAMKCASLLRESLWSMVSELHSDLDFDYRGYTEENMARFDSAWRHFDTS